VTVTIDAAPLRGVAVCGVQVFGPGCVTGDSTHNEIQYVDVRATGGTFTLTFGGQTTDPIPFNASAVQLELALEGLTGGVIDDVKVSKNSNVFKVEFKGAQANTDVAPLVATVTGLKPVQPADLIDYSITITRGPAKNKVRIITGAVCAVDADHNGVCDTSSWILTLSKPWLSPFTHDSSKPDATSGYTLDVTNPNLLV